MVEVVLHKVDFIPPIANTLETCEAVVKTMTSLRGTFPDNLLRIFTKDMVVTKLPTCGEVLTPSR